jgi:hypothetical protein
LHKTITLLIGRLYIRAYLEGDWTPNWHHWNEFPRGKILCDIDNKADISRAKQEIGGTVCLAGGIPDRMFILGTPNEIRTRVRELCETVGKDGGLILNGGCAIPYLKPIFGLSSMRPWVGNTVIRKTEAEEPPRFASGRTCPGTSAESDHPVGGSSERIGRGDGRRRNSQGGMGDTRTQGLLLAPFLGLVKSRNYGILE